MKIRAYFCHQWKWPIEDFNLISIGGSWFDWFGAGPSWLQWSSHVTILGVTLVVKGREKTYAEQLLVEGWER